MALFRRKKSSYWWVRFTAPNGEQIRESTGTADRRAAQEYEDQKRAALWRQHKLGERPRYRWQEAVERWVIESAAHASLEDSKIHLRWVHRFLYDVHLDAIDRTLLDKIVAARCAEGVAVATSNRLLEIIRVILRRAQQDWEWIDRIPAIRLQPNPVRRIRCLKREEADRLLSVLPPHQAALVRFSLATGLREKNVTRLEWSQVDLTRRMAWIHPDQAKAKKPIGVPLNNEAVGVLRQEAGKHDKRVFTWQGRPIDKANTRA